MKDMCQDCDKFSCISDPIDTVFCDFLCIFLHFLFVSVFFYTFVDQKYEL